MHLCIRTSVPAVLCSYVYTNNLKELYSFLKIDFYLNTATKQRFKKIIFFTELENSVQSVVISKS